MNTEVNASSLMTLVLTFALGALSGFAFGGLPGGLFGAMLGASSGIVIVYKLSKQQGRSLDTVELPADMAPAHALRLVSAVVSRPHEPVVDFGSRFLGELEEATRYADRSPEAALVAVQKICDRNPTSPAVWAELAHRHRAVGDDEAAMASLSKALSFAVMGGMNGLALRLFRQWRDAIDAVDLDAAAFARLARVLQANDEPEAADWARGRIAGAAARRHNAATDTSSPAMVWRACA